MFAASKTNSVVAVSNYQISRSLRFNRPDTAYLNRTPGTAGNRSTWTFSTWVKRNTLNDIQTIFSAGTPFSGAYLVALFFFDNNLDLAVYNSSGTVAYRITSTALYRDVSAWYHVVAVVDSTQATASNRLKLYVNGVQITAFSAASYPNQNDIFNVNATVPHFIGTYAYDTSVHYISCNQTETYLIDGQALTPSSFGQTNAQTGVWEPIAYSGSYGTNGFYVNFSDNSNTTAATLGKDYSGNGNNWTPNNFSVTAGINNDSMVDTPTPYGVDTGAGGTVRGNYCTLNPLSATGTSTASDGNLYGIPSGPSNNGLYGTIAVNSGKWYWEDSPTLGGSYPMIGIARVDAGVVPSWQNAYGYAYYPSGNKYNNGSSAYGASYTTGDVIGVALDMDAGTVTFYKNGTSQGVAFSSLTGYITPYISTDNSSVIHWMNFGQRPFAYTAPSGFKALCTQNLPTPTIGATTATQAIKYFNPATYTGNGSTNSITTVGFQPDWTWLKNRSVPATAGNHFATDAVRGAGIGIYPNLTDAEANNTTLFTGFTSTGFNVAGTNSSLNENGVTYVSWNWKANGTGSSNTAGSITSTVSANTTSGFSVVTYTGNGTGGATVGHGIGIAPSMMIIKRRSTTAAWVVYHASLGPTQGIYLNLTDAAYTGSTFWYNTAPSSSVLTLGTVSENNVNSSTYVAYCFAEIAGYSKFGSYTGNGSTDGPFVYTGFRPAFVLVKKSDSGSESWVIVDTTRNTSNVMNSLLRPNTSDAEATATWIDALSNGFKCRETYTGLNASGGTYIYMAFASAPLKFSLAR
jgi:hypothetical protein